MPLRFAALTFVLSLATGPIAVASIEMKFDEVGPNGGVSANLAFNGDSVAARIGQMFFHARNQSGAPVLDLIDGPDSDTALNDLVSFCIEPAQYVSGSWKTYSKTPVANAPDPFISGAPGGYHIGQHRASALDLLADNFWGRATGSNVVDAVAFQLSVWEIVHEGLSGSLSDPPLAGSWSVSDNQGTFFVSNDNPGSSLAGAIQTANDWLAEVSAFYDNDVNTTSSLSHNDQLSLVALTNPDWQDQIVQYHLPEPVSAVVWGGLMAFCVCRRQR
ncbi:hypothetical protein KOR34_36370 [Posidoniimonas corsicana]|uniref:PEP-CTERM protein-sorting domain-containing protein n=1 Tax=Posidoniimonas corsicana TaxID=1938618 RepID=A0A5C5V761_9BACT|nr:hypothetical protein [Posidoniimonas corsicana]TWT33803.1 hypothetical protein KOR34_36370 [Posidoniimonas corsicana]